MKSIPKFTKNLDALKYAIEIIEFDIEKECTSRDISIKSWGRLDFRENSLKKKKFSDNKEACQRFSEILHENSLGGTVSIVWSDARLAEIRTNIPFLHDFGMEILTEDWDVWIFGNGWIIEKYHEGELVFFLHPQPPLTRPDSSSNPPSP